MKHTMRFGTKNKGTAGRALGWLTSLYLSAALLIAVVIGAGNIQKATEAEQLKRLKDSVIKAAVHCYAVQGAYPTDIKELEERYGIVYDHKKYMVDYHCFASNLMPDITVLLR